MTSIAKINSLKFKSSHTLSHSQYPVFPESDFTMSVIFIPTIEFSLNVFTEFSKYSKYLLSQGFEPATSYVRDQDATIAPA